MGCARPWLNTSFFCAFFLEKRAFLFDMIIEDRYNKPWVRYEYVLVLNLYLKMPFGKMHKANRDIIELAKLMKRTPDSVAMRLVNFAALDPVLAGRNIKGLRGGIDQCKPYWDEFCGDRESLVFESESILADIQSTTIEDKYNEFLDFDRFVQGETRLKEVKTRVNQYVFRQMILSLYDNRCAITGINISDLLLASHIKPWSIDVDNRLNPQNGICLCAMYDRAFDQGLISFDNQYRVMLSPRLKGFCSEKFFDYYFGKIEGRELMIAYEDYRPDVNFLEYHYDCIFQR